MDRDDEYEWIKEDAIMDSRTCETMCGKMHIDEEDLVPTEALK